MNKQSHDVANPCSWLARRGTLGAAHRAAPSDGARTAGKEQCRDDPPVPLLLRLLSLTRPGPRRSP